MPNNVTLTIAGDFDVEQAKEWVKKYFGEIEKGEAIPEMEKQPVNLSETKKLYYEDNFARAPQLTLTWPGVLPVPSGFLPAGSSVFLLN